MWPRARRAIRGRISNIFFIKSCKKNISIYHYIVVTITEELVQRIRNRSQILIWYLTAAFGLSAFAIAKDTSEPLLIVPFLGLAAALWFQSQHRVIGQMYLYLSEHDPESWYASSHFYDWLTKDQINRLLTRLFLFWSPSAGCYLYIELTAAVSSTEGPYILSTTDILRPSSFVALFFIPYVIIRAEQHRHILYRKKGFRTWASGYTKHDLVDFCYRLALIALGIVFIISFGLFFG